MQPTASEDIISFNIDKIEVKYVSGRWKIVEGSHWIFDFEKNEKEARKAMCIIKKYGFNAVGYVGRPDASLVYMVKSSSKLKNLSYKTIGTKKLMPRKNN